MNSKSICKIESCSGFAIAKGLCNKHYGRLHRNGDPEKLIRDGSGWINDGGYRNISRNGLSILEHVFIAEKALGRKLRGHEVVHHANGNKLDNVNTNLVICTTQYHNMIHQRMRAFELSGNPNFRLCTYCKEYDNPKNMYASQEHAHHRNCVNSHQREARRTKTKVSQTRVRTL